MKIKSFLLFSIIVLLVFVMLPIQRGGRAADYTYWVYSTEDSGDKRFLGIIQRKVQEDGG